MGETSEAAILRPAKIVSGGQTGVDRGALDAAIALGIAHGGWCPRGRLAEDGPIPLRYALVETETAEYTVRTERNVVDSDATLILARGRLRGGTKFTQRMAARHRKPRLVVDLDQPPAPEAVRQWLQDNGVSILNIAGPRESQSPGIAALAYEYVRKLFGAS